MREIVRLCKQYQETKEFHIQASQTVIDMLLEEESQALELLQAFVRASEILCPWDNRSPPIGCIQ